MATGCARGVAATDLAVRTDVDPTVLARHSRQLNAHIAVRVAADGARVGHHRERRALRARPPHHHQEPVRHRRKNAAIRSNTASD